MTIYILDKDPTKCAQAPDNNTLKKMIEAIAQVLCNVHHYRAFRYDGIDAQYTIPSAIPLKETKQDDWAQWSMECVANYGYLVELGLACVKEFYFRMSDFSNIEHSIAKMNMDEFSDVIYWARDNVPDLPRQACPECNGCGHNGKAPDGRYYACENCKGHDDSLGEGYIDLMTPFPLVMPKKYHNDILLGAFGECLTERSSSDTIINSYRNYYQAKLKQKIITKCTDCVGNECTDEDCCYQCDCDSGYRYNHDKVKWDRREKPDWLEL